VQNLMMDRKSQKCIELLRFIFQEMKSKKGYYLLLPGLFLILIMADSSAQESKTFIKDPIEVIRSLYLDDAGEPSREVFLRRWALFPSETRDEIIPYFTISINQSETVMKNGKQLPQEKAKIMNPDFYISSTRTFTSDNIAKPVWDGRVYQEESRLLVGGYSSDYNERHIGDIDSRGRFIKTFFGFTGIGAEEEVLEGRLKLGPSFYSPTDSEGKQRDNYKVEYVNREGKRFITHDYTEGTSEDIVIALSPDGSEIEMKVELAGFLTDHNGNLVIPSGNKIDIAVGAEAASDFYGSDSWGADSSPIIYGYKLK